MPTSCQVVQTEMAQGSSGWSVRSVLLLAGQLGRLMVNGKHQGYEPTQVGAPGACQVGTRKAGLRSIGQKSGRLMADLARPREYACHCSGEPKDDWAELRLLPIQGGLPAFIRPSALGGAAGSEDAQRAAVGVQFVSSSYWNDLRALSALRF